jgi:hypothetical protein
MKGKPPGNHSRAGLFPRPSAIPPDVIVDFLFDQGLFHVEVANITDAPAYDVSVKFTPAFRGLGGTCPVSTLQLFRLIRFLAPRRRIRTFLDTSPAYFAREEPEVVTARISFTDASGRFYRRQIVHDLNIYKGLAYVVTPNQNSPLEVSSTKAYENKEQAHVY